MIRKSVQRFSEKIMLKQKDRAGFEESHHALEPRAERKRRLKCGLAPNRRGLPLLLDPVCELRGAIRQNQQRDADGISRSVCS